MLEYQENARIAIKCQNFQKMLEFQENVDRISRKGYNFFLEKATISREKKCQKYQKMLEFLENVRIAKHVRISRIATISRNFYNFQKIYFILENPGIARKS